MSAIPWTKVRGFIAAVVTIAGLVVLVSAMTVLGGYKVPVLYDIAEFLGLDKLNEE